MYWLPHTHGVRMSRSRNVGYLIVLALILSATLVLGGFQVCPKCGHENEDRSAQCKHCDARFVEQTKDEPAPQPAREKPDSTSLAPRAALGEMKLAQSYLEKKDVETARLFFRNASALAILCDPPPSALVASQLLERIRECEGSRGWVRRKCPVCEGKGKVPLRGSSSLPNVAGRRCPHCKGRATVPARATIDEVKFLMGRAKRAYVAMQRSRGLVPVGNAWVPEDLAQALPAEDRGRLKQLLADPCPDCLGMGRIDCGRCKGSGVGECSAKACEGGMVTVEVKARLSKSFLRRTEKCKTCGGTGATACEKCRGEGSLLCQDCSGVGDRTACEACEGQGIVSCRKCRGVGTYKGDECTRCGGKGKGLCDACGGDGRDR